MATLTIDGAGGDDAIVITATGIDSGSYSINGGPAVAFSGVTQVAVSGGAGNDTLTIVNPDGSLFAPANGISYDGGGQSGDALAVVGGAASNASLAAGATPDAGTLTHASGAITQIIDFAGIAPITDTVTAASLTINGTAGTDAITVTDGGIVSGFQTTQVSSPTFESVTFANKGTMIIDGQGGGDTVSFNNPNPATGLTAVTLRGVGSVTQTGALKVTDLDITASGDVQLTNSLNAVVALAARVSGSLNFTDSTSLFINHHFPVVGANVTLTVPHLDGGAIAALDGIVTLQPLSADADIFLGANNPDSFGLSNGQLHEMTADTLRIGSTSDTGDIFVTIPITADGHIATLSLRTGGAILDSDRFELTDITVDNLALQAAAGIGSVDDLDVAVSNLAFDNTTSGDVRIGNAGTLTIAAVDGLLSSSNGGGAAQVINTAGGALTVAAPIAATGDIDLESSDNAGPGDDLTVVAGSTLQSSAGFVQLVAGDNISVPAGSIVQSPEFANFVADYTSADAGVGATVGINGTIIAPLGVITTGPDADFLIGSPVSDHLDGGAGADTMTGRAGDDFYEVDNAGDAVVENAGEGADTVDASINFALPANVENLTLAGVADLQGFGNSLANMITGNTGNNLIDGRAGADLMQGGVGNDTYFADNAGDVVIENASQGNDTVFSTVNFLLPANVETLVLQGSADLQGFGNTLANVIHGNSGNNLIDGAAGIDLMVGGAGNDVYFVDDPSDSAFEAANEGNDTVFTTANYGLAANVETLVMQGSADLQGYGNNQANVIYGNAGNNLINGAGGADLMVGGAGNDTYFVDDPGDSVFENPGEGSDVVLSSANFALSADVETLVMQGSGDLQGYGNNQANTIFGNAGNNLINGGGGADTMLGGVGNDTYFVDNGLDQVVENPGEGTDTVFSIVHFILPANVETLVLQGSANANGTGNALNNNIFGNSGDNVLDGQDGADVLTGNAGNDTFVFIIGQGNGDTVVDFAGNGAAAGDSLHFIGYGAGATFTNVDATHWQVNFNGGASHEVITFMNGAIVDPSDVLFS